ncbi:MAG: ribosome-binding factor A [Patescibacteria group bacterium]
MPTPDRMAKINELLGQKLSQLIEEDAEELGMLVVVSVDTIRDLSKSHVFLALINPDEQQPADLPAKLKERAYHYRSQLGKTLNLRRIPEFQFHLETQPEVFDSLEATLAELDKESRAS